MEKPSGCFGFLFSSNDPQKSKLPILILKKDIPKELSDTVSLDKYAPIFTKTTIEAISQYKKSPFPVVIAALGINPDKSDNYFPLLEEIRKQNKATFVIIYSHTASDSAPTRQSCFDQGANMVSKCLKSISHVLEQIYFQISSKGELVCPICSLPSLSEDALWHHLPLYHVYERNIVPKCPLCGVKCKPNLMVHYHNSHGPCGRKEHPLDVRDETLLYAFSLVVVHRKKDNKFLVVQEFANSGFWLPGGGVDLGENLFEAAKRETLEEAGINIKITGVLTIQYSSTTYVRLRAIFYAEPVDENQSPKSIPDYESAGASYISFEELQHVLLRGSEPEIWFKYVLQGKPIFPISVFTGENDKF